MTEPHGHARPDAADMKAALRATRAIVGGADPAAHEAAGGGTCCCCTALAGISFVCTVVSTVLGDEAFMSERTRQVILAAIDAAEGELRGSAN